jgi:hypothetical protein
MSDFRAFATRKLSERLRKSSSRRRRTFPGHIQYPNEPRVVPPVTAQLPAHPHRGVPLYRHSSRYTPGRGVGRPGVLVLRPATGAGARAVSGSQIQVAPRLQVDGELHLQDNYRVTTVAKLSTVADVQYLRELVAQTLADSLDERLLQRPDEVEVRVLCGLRALPVRESIMRVTTPATRDIATRCDVALTAVCRAVPLA